MSIELMAAWGRQWAVVRLSREELDPTLMMWVILRRARVRGGRLPEARVVMLFDITDAPRGRRYWWLVLDRPDIDLCLSDPGFAVDLTWTSNARALAPATSRGGRFRPT